VGSGDNIIMEIILVLVPMILSLSVHEFAHAWSARLLGDTTAQAEGRLTLNPLAHIDPIGTLLLPVILIVSASGFFFGWAKPVPVNPTRFTRKISMRKGMLLTAAAGPASNLVLAVVSAAILAVFWHGDLVATDSAFVGLLIRMLSINIALAVFNLIPIGPLDGQKVLVGLLPYESATKFERFNYQYGSWAMLAVIIFGARLIAIPYSAIITALLTVFQLR